MEVTGALTEIRRGGKASFANIGDIRGSIYRTDFPDTYDDMNLTPGTIVTVTGTLYTNRFNDVRLRILQITKKG